MRSFFVALLVVLAAIWLSSAGLAVIGVRWSLPHEAEIAVIWAVTAALVGSAYGVPVGGLLPWMVCGGAAWYLVGLYDREFSSALVDATNLPIQWVLSAVDKEGRPGGYTFHLARLVSGMLGTLGATLMLLLRAKGVPFQRRAAEWAGLGALGGLAYALLHHVRWTA